MLRKPERQWFVGELESPLGILTIATSGDALAEVSFEKSDLPSPGAIPAIWREAAQQLTAYFRGQLRQFDLPLVLDGTPFQVSVWQALAKIPFGQTLSYADLAETAGFPKAFRAAGQANNRNRIAIVVPCHRVIGASGALVGYAGGLQTKEWLLSHEKSVLSDSVTPVASAAS